MTSSKIVFEATLFRPAGEPGADWTFLNLPLEASKRLPSRSMASVEGSLNGLPFTATLDPDGRGGHWLKVEPKLREAAGIKAGDRVALEIAPVDVEPEPEVPEELREALEAVPGAKEVWLDITSIARRDWVQWVTSGKKAETRVKRIDVACSKLAAGKRRPCCFDRSGMYSKSLSCPQPDLELSMVDL